MTLFVTLFLFLGTAYVNAAPSLATIQKAKAVVENARYQLPIEAGYGLVFKLGIIHMLKANPNSEDMQLLKGGITFHYNYYSIDGDFIYAMKITPADIK